MRPPAGGNWSAWETGPCQQVRVSHCLEMGGTTGLKQNKVHLYPSHVVTITCYCFHLLWITFFRGVISFLPSGSVSLGGDNFTSLPVDMHPELSQRAFKAFKPKDAVVLSEFMWPRPSESGSFLGLSLTLTFCFLIEGKSMVNACLRIKSAQRKASQSRWWRRVWLDPAMPEAHTTELPSLSSWYILYKLVWVERI